MSRSLRGNVDRNELENVKRIKAVKVVPYVGTWIEIAVKSNVDKSTMSFPTWERG